MTFLPSHDLDAVIAALEVLRAHEAGADAAAGAWADADAHGEADAGAGAGAGAGADADAHGEADAGAGAGASVASLSGARQLVRSLAAIGTARAALEAVAVRRIAALEQVRALNPEADPVRVAGHPDVGSLLAELWRTSLAGARQLCTVARATAPRRSLHGEVLPAEFPELAEALLGADTESEVPRVSVEQAAVIVRELEKTGPGCTLEQRALGERVLVELAPGVTVEQMRRLAIQVRDRLDEDGTEPRDHIQRRRRSLTITTTADGMIHVDWFLDAESAGHVLPQITAYVSEDFRSTHDATQSGEKSGVRFQLAADSETEAGSQMPESRSLAQIRSDGAVDVFRHHAGCGHQATQPPVTMIVRVTLADLRTGTGTAEIDGVPTPITADTARKLAADANLIPAVLGEPSEVLDLGRAKRLFNTAQKHALAERDGGCAWTGCPHPPAYTQAHHIRWWDRDTGPTDLRNGILLCSNHHHRVHDDGWEITVHDNVPWFIPPAHHDPTRTPRPGGRLRVPPSPQQS